MSLITRGSYGRPQHSPPFANSLPLFGKLFGFAKLLADRTFAAFVFRTLRAFFSRGVGLLLLCASAAHAASLPPQMAVPGKFDVGAMGAFAYTVPIKLPPGTAGMAPALSLDYSSQYADGTVGFGWALAGLAEISHCPRTIAQDHIHGAVNYDTNDRYCMEGQRLVLISGTYGADGSQYRTEVESFSKIIAHGSAGTGPAWFEVHTKSGQILQFGNTTASRALTVNATTGAVGPTASAWAVNQIADTKGNYINVLYTNDTTNGQVYPTEVDYTGNAGSSPVLTPYNSVKFSYTTRTVIVPSYQAGMVQQLTVLLSDIRTYSGTTEVLDYKLGYRAASSGIYHDELTSIKQCDASETNCLATMTIGWQGGNGLPTMSIIPYTGTSEPTPGSTFFPLSYAQDINGDGLLDLPSSNATYPSWLGTGGGNFSASAFYPGTANSDFNGDGYTDEIGVINIDPYIPVTAYMSLNNKAGDYTSTATTTVHPGWFIDDFNGDGLTDVFDAPYSAYGGYPDTTGQYYFYDGAGHFNAGTNFPALTGTATKDRLILSGDFDGDGCADLMTQGSVSEIYYSCSPATPSFTLPDWQDAGGYAVYEAITGDFNGDGKTDILSVSWNKTGTACSDAGLYLSTGTGIKQTSFAVPTDWCKYRISAGDFNGDGKTDIALVVPGTNGFYGYPTAHQIWLSTGTGFVEAGTIANTNTDCCTPPYFPTQLTQGSVADWSSTGAADLWLVQSVGGNPLYTFAYTPELVTSIQNGLGATTTVSYLPLNTNGAFYTKSTSATYPTQDMDGPIYAVSKITTSNGIGGTMSDSYTYTGAQKDLAGRGFLGFGQIAVTDNQTGVIQTTKYATLFPLTGTVTAQIETAPKTGGGTVTISDAEDTQDQISLGAGVDGVARYFVAIKSGTVTRNDEDFSTGSIYPLPTVTTTNTYDCDTGTTSICAGTSPTGFGNLTVMATSVSDGSSKTANNTYTNDATNWYLGRLTAANVHSIVGSSNLTRQTSYTYDPASGLITSEIAEPETSSDLTLKLETDYGYDFFGNKTSATTKGCAWVSSTSCSTTTGTATRLTSIMFDTTTLHGQFATQVTNALSQYATSAYATTNNTGFGVPSSRTDLNSLTTSWAYDTFGRPTLETRPDGNKSAAAYTYCTTASCPVLPVGQTLAQVPTNAQFYVLSTPENSSGTQNGPISVTYYDGLSRVIAADVEGFDASGTGCTTTAPCWIRVATQYDTDGRVAQTSRPYFVSGGTAKWTVYTYDALSRVTKATFPDSSKTIYGFMGLTTTVTNDKSQVTTTVKNAQALNASVEDANSKITSYVYDAFGDLLTVTDPLSNVTTNTYDIRGRKKTAADPDMGSWSYVYDGFGELYSQTDAKSQITTLTYDALGRTLTRTEPGLTSTWVYDTATGKGVGQLASATAGSSYTRTYVYDTLARPSTVTLTVSGTAHTYTETYDANGRLSTTAYPSGFTAKDTYTTLGYLYTVSDNSLGTVFLTAKTRDAELHLLTQTAANGITTTDAFDPNTGRPVSILAGTSNSVSNQAFTFDTLGNLTSRTWLNNAGASTEENACYDALNRVTNTLVTTGTACTGTGAITIAYDALGNITSKSDICTAANCFGYGAGSAGPHALTSISGTYNGVANPTFAYDANGNMSSGAGRGVTFTSFNMAASITDGSSSDTLTYDTEHSRITQVATGTNAGTTVYLNDPVSGAMEEAFTASSALTYRDYIMADGHMVALRSLGLSSPPMWGTPAWDSFPWTAQSTTPVLLYFTLDHLGSISVVTDASGAIVERDSYDAWGLRRNPDGTAANCGAVTSSTTRGFTGQEMMDNVCFINFNARVYDPSLGRFMSADSVVPDLYDLQSLDRYSYVNNGPLSLTDPTGHGTSPTCVCLNIGGDTALAISQSEDINVGVAASIAGIFQGSTQFSASATNGPSGSGVTDQSNNMSSSGLVATVPGGGQVFNDPTSTTGFTLYYDKNSDLGQELSQDNGDGGTYKFDVATQTLSYASGSPSDNSIESVTVTASRENGDTNSTQIYLGYTNTAFPYLNHTFVVARNPATGAQFATRAGPNYNWKTGQITDPSQPAFAIHAESGLYAPGFRDYGDTNAPLQYVGQLNMSFSDVQASMNAFANTVNSYDFPYLGPVSNSNSYASIYLESLGFSPAPSEWVPGWAGPSLQENPFAGAIH